MSIWDRIGTLADRLQSRVGRLVDNCLVCGRPTRSHIVGSGKQCHRCHEADRYPVATDGGRPVDGPDRERLEPYVENHPNATAIEIVAAPETSVGPDDRDLVEDVIASVRGGQDEDDIPASGSSNADDEDVDDAPEWPCAKPRCPREAVNPHQDSLCPKHHPGSTTQLEAERLQERLGDADDDDQEADGRDLLAEAQAVAGEEDADERESSSAGAVDDALADAIAREQQADQPEDDEPDGDDFLMAAMGDDEAATAFAKETNEDDDPDAAPASSGHAAMPAGALPLGQLDALDPEQRRRAAKKRGLEWPSTDEARDRLRDTIHDVIRHEDQRVVDAPTSLGKSYTVATERWGARDDVTGDRPVIHLSQTRDARDEAISAARDHGGEYFVLRSRDEACPVAAGDHDPVEDEDDGEDRQVITIDGESASEWIQARCEGQGIPFSAAHRHLEEHNDQGVELPCCADHECPAILQWERWRDGEHPLTIATHNFAHVPSVRANTNVVLDEEVDFDQELSTDRVRRAVGAYLREIDATVQTWEAFIQLASNRTGGDAGAERDALQHDLNTGPERDWYFADPDAHTLAPALARAIFHAEDRSNGRRVGKTPYEPPRLDAGARDDDEWNREWLTVVLDEANDVRTVRSVPDFSMARSVVGLDAHPSLPVWQANTTPWIQRAEVLDVEERRLWRRYERGLRVVQVGDATRPLASGEYFDWQGARAVIEQLHDEYGAKLRTALTAASVEDELSNLMDDAGIPDPETMHFGEEKSRNDFAHEGIGLVNGCIDPGDDYVVDLLAELDLDAEPERSEGECPRCEGDGCHRCDGTGHLRAHGRGFVGADAETATEILASVRENHTAQAAGRYARNPDDPSSTATVFVRTDAMPPGFADVQTPGVVWTYGQKQERVVDVLQEAPEPLSASEIADRADCSKEHVRSTLQRFVDLDDEGDIQDTGVHALEGAGDHGATLYATDGVPNAGVVDLADGIANSPVWDSYTWALAIDDPDVAGEGDAPSTGSSPTPSGGLFAFEDPPDRGG